MSSISLSIEGRRLKLQPIADDGLTFRLVQVSAPLEGEAPSQDSSPAKSPETASGSENEKEMAGKNPLVEAARFARSDVLARLLSDSRADPNRLDSEGRLPLLVAIEGHHHACTSFLLADRRTDVNKLGLPFTEDRCRSPLGKALAVGNFKAAHQLLEHPCHQLTEAQLQFIITHDHLDTLNLLLDRSQKEPVLYDPQVAWRMLDVVAAYNLAWVTDQVASHAKSLAARRPAEMEGVHPFYTACIQGHARAAKAMMKNKLLPDDLGLDQDAPGMRAFLSQHTAQVRIMMGDGPLPAAVLAVLSGSDETLELFLSRELPLLPGGATVLHLAVLLGRRELVNCLLRHGFSKTEALDARGHTALEYAILSGDRLMVRCFGIARVQAAARRPRSSGHDDSSVPFLILTHLGQPEYDYYFKRSVVA